MTGRDFTDRDIHLALDGELPADERADFDAWLAANPDRLALSRRYEADRERLAAAVAFVADEPVPPTMAATVAGTAASRKRRAHGWRAAAAAALLAVGGLAGYGAGNFDWSGEKSPDYVIADRALDAYVIYAAEKLHVVEVGADEKDHLVGWLSKKVGTKLIAPDFSASGFELIGGRLLPAAHEAAAQFMYQNHTGLRVSLYVTQNTGARETGFRLIEENGARAFYWVDQGFCYVVTGTIGERELLMLANQAYKQLLSASG